MGVLGLMPERTTDSLATAPRAQLRWGGPGVRFPGPPDQL